MTFTEIYRGHVCAHVCAKDKKAGVSVCLAIGRFFFLSYNERASEKEKEREGGREGGRDFFLSPFVSGRRSDELAQAFLS